MKLKINIKRIENIMKLILNSFIHKKKNMKLQLHMHKKLAILINDETFHIDGNLILSLLR